MQEKRLTNEGKHHFLLLYKQARDKKGIEESMHVYINRARLTAWEWAYFQEKYHKATPTPFFEEPLNFIPHDRIYGTSISYTF